MCKLHIHQQITPKSKIYEYRLHLKLTTVVYIKVKDNIISIKFYPILIISFFHKKWILYLSMLKKYKR